jgi:secreted PhoX family phosphatase
MKLACTLSLLFFISHNLFAQSIGDFQSIEPRSQDSQFIIPSSHRFQEIIEEGDELTEGSVLPGNTDFTGYVPIDGSNENGYLSINAELTPGGVSILDINFDSTTKLWNITKSQKVDFSDVVGTARNCSGTVTPWYTIVTCEESVSNSDSNNDGYNDLGWCVEIDPANKEVIDKRWALGNFKHENIIVHSNLRTVYQGADSNPGYLYKFVADNEQDLSNGKLYVYKGSKNGSGNWIQINNTTPTERNSTLAQSNNVIATVFNGIEDVEIGPDGLVYFAVKGEGRVYRFQDSDPILGTIVSQMEPYVGGTSYDIEHVNGTTSVSWGNGNDNLAFDGEGNLWVLQDGGRDYIWVVENGHTQTTPKVKIFGRTPAGSEPTGITFSPDYRFLFMSIQHPNSGNNVSMQTDAAGNAVGFGKDISLVIALNENLGAEASPISGFSSPLKIILYPNPSTREFTIDLGGFYKKADVSISDIMGQVVLAKSFNSIERINIDLSEYNEGNYFLIIKSNEEIVSTHRLLKK